jgi:hypothetical protein
LTPDELPGALGHVRDLTARYLSGTPDAFDATRELLDYLLRVTVMARHGILRFSSVIGGRGNQQARVIGVRSQPIPLNNGNYLLLLQSLKLDEVPNAPSKLRVYTAVYQYQLDVEGERWVFRYEYLRLPEDPHPSSHLHVRGVLAEHEHCLADGETLERIHFPTGRITLEAVIRCLIEQFAVPTTEDAEIWRPLLTESETAFDRIAHRPASGPAQ